MAKEKVKREIALKVAKEIIETLTNCCEKIEIAGSLRREKEEVGDIEILYVPKYIERNERNLLFEVKTIRNVADEKLEELLRKNYFHKRINKIGSTVYGDKNKLLKHVESGINVDLFSTTIPAWYNYLVCRTGGAANNALIAGRAKDMGWKWKVYEEGFENRNSKEIRKISSEEEVYAFVGLPYIKPKERL